MSFILDQSSLISCGEYSWSLICEVIGSQPLIKNSLVFSNTCQVMWAHLLLVNFDFSDLIQGWFNTLHIFKTSSYRGHKSPKNTHNNSANVASISFNSYQFLGERLVFAFFVYSASAWVLVPWYSAAASSCLSSYSIPCVLLGITINGEIPLSVLLYISTGTPGLNFVFTISSIFRLMKSISVSI